MLNIYTTALDMMCQIFENTVFMNIYNPTALHSRHAPLCIDKQMIFMCIMYWLCLN